MQKIQLLLLFIVVGFNVSAAQVDTLLVKSMVMNKYIKNIVLLPESYSEAKANFPVVYLLHGAGGNHTDWLNAAPNIKEYVDKHKFIIVCPNAGKTSWYFDSPVDPSSQYETYISKELVLAVDVTYSTIKNANGRAITGLSMGGHGAIYLAFQHPNIWGAVGSMSGGLDLCPFPKNWEIYKRLGVYDQNKSRWQNHSVINMIDNLNDDLSLKIIFDCGFSDFFYDVNKQFEEKLKQCNIAHQFIERAGSHNWEFWRESISFHLPFFADFFSSHHIEKIDEAIDVLEEY